MNVKIEKLNISNITFLNSFDKGFDIDSRLVLYSDGEKIKYDIKEMLTARKVYKDNEDDINYDEYIDNPDKVVYLAFVENEIAGQIIMKKSWNQYIHVEEIMISDKFRGFGIGKNLMELAKDWARTSNMIGVMLETQNNNVAACKFYEKCGFHIGGFDFNLYRGIDRNKDEVALYWYWFC